MATPRFSFSGWNTASIAPKVPVAPPPATNLPTAADLRANAKAKGFTPMPPPEFRAQIEAMPGGIKAWSEAIMKGIDPGIGTGKPTGTWAYDKTGKLVSSLGETFTGAPPPTTVTTPPPATTTGLPGSAPQTNAANPDIPGWLQGEIDKINAQNTLRNAVVGGGGGGGVDLGIGQGATLAGGAALIDAQTRHQMLLNQMSTRSQIENLMAERNRFQTNAFGFTNPLDFTRISNIDRTISSLRPNSGWVGGGGGRYINGLLNGTGFA